MSVGIQQYVVLQFVCNSILVAVKAWDWLHPSSCEDALQGMMQYDVWNATSLLMVVADFFTCSIALFAVLQYEHAFNDALRPVRPFWKFWGVKGLLSVNFMQTSVLTESCQFSVQASPLDSLNMLRVSGPCWCLLLVNPNYYLLSAESLALAALLHLANECSIASFLLLVEANFGALLNLWAYPVKHPRPARESVDFVDELQDDEPSRTAQPFEIEAPAPAAETLGRKQSA
eukprot:s2061_g5.t1